jgi:hypothetical protein
MWCPRGVPLTAPPLGVFFFIFLVLENGMFMQSKVEAKSIWPEIAGGSYTRTLLS